MARKLLYAFAAAMLAATPATAQHDDSRSRVYSTVGGAFGNGSFISASAGVGMRLTHHLGLDLELVHLSAVGSADRATWGFPVGTPEHAGQGFSLGALHRPSLDVTTFLAKTVAEWPVADGRLFPYLTAGGGIGRVLERSGAGDAPIPWGMTDSIANATPPGTASAAGISNDDINGTGFYEPTWFTGLQDRSALGLALSLGGGVDVRLWRGLGVGVDIRWLRVLLTHDHVDTAQVGLSTSYRF